MGSWDGLDRKRPPAGRKPTADEKAAELAARAESEIAQLAARVLGTADGVKLLAHLRRMTKDVVAGPDAAVGALYHREGQRQLVHQLETWTAQGLRYDPSEFRDGISRD